MHPTEWILYLILEKMKKKKSVVVVKKQNPVE